jgi:hypothetical protein
MRRLASARRICCRRWPMRLMKTSAASSI